ncbi:unannotated protein [freshwater metagenome]|uniref:Unannotated protein n=1 Tax=freshwater metagenome TaxID=449393 RepID=A0A6J6BGL2_9ZZZZ
MRPTSRCPAPFKPIKPNTSPSRSLNVALRTFSPDISATFNTSFPYVASPNWKVSIRRPTMSRTKDSGVKLAIAPSSTSLPSRKTTTRSATLKISSKRWET